MWHQENSSNEKTTDMFIFHFVNMIFMPLPEALCFRVVCPSVHPSVACNTLFPPVHGSVFPSEQPWPFSGMSVHPSVWRDFWALARKCIEGIAWDLACWCILATFRTNKTMVTVCWFLKFWHYFDLVKWVKFGVSRHFPKNEWRK